MANCCVCGKNYGFMSGGKEPYTGKNLLVCNECGSLLKDLNDSITSLNLSEFEKTKNELKHISRKSSQEFQDVINEYLKNTDNIFAQNENAVNSLTETNQNTRTCPICQHAIYPNEHICDFCGYSPEEFPLSPDYRKKIMLNKQQQILKNAIYEYKVEIISDSAFLGKTSKSELEDTIMQYALNGWKLHSVTTNEIGKNAMLGINSTLNNTILVFERCIKAEEK